MPIDSPPSGGELVPARMINEVLYCERLMYLEWVQKEFADNWYTVEGRAVHRRTDEPMTNLPSADAAPSRGEGTRPVVARSLWLSSDAIGITAKIDLVEEQDTGLVPVEYKRGRPPNLPEGAYLPERAQICAQILLLREHGYSCPHGILYFAATRQRVVVEPDAELIAATHRAVARARELAMQSQLPPPLVGSPKCVRCSLAPLCLPDEVNALSSEPEAAHEPVKTSPPQVRQLHPSRDDRVPLYVQDHAARVGLKSNCLVVRREGEPEQEVRLPNTSQVVVIGNAQVSTQALAELMGRGIPVAFFTGGGWYRGRAMGNDSNNVELRLAQYRTATDPAFCLRLARSLIESKLRNCRTLLRRNHREIDPTTLGTLRQLARKAANAPSLETLLGIEGTGARVYYSELPGLLRAGPGLGGAFDFMGRNRRPPRDPVNAMLSFAYALLTKELVFATNAVGLDPLLGYYHQPRFGRPSLALDLMEEFRPLVADSVVVSAINNGVVQPSDFMVSPVGVALKPGGRRKFIEAFERRMDQLISHPVFGYRISYRRERERAL